ncbi:MAG: flavodoxin [Ruminobacter sp.]|uniref:flavodoxin n=1 Tax=Ruminobacter sp. TaxID=2774296 RepID=UPI001B49C959|nr:flavodoxin [Ruminobacter sp.]MBP3748931.1 flavodoxin [Ruminobacter sp.]
MTKNLVIYFSRPGLNFVGGDIRFLDKGNTETAVEYLLNEIDADVFRIETVTKYSEDYYECTNEAKAEKKLGIKPDLVRYLDDVSGYDDIFVCGPCWWSTFPMALYSQLEKLNLNGKRIHPLVTHEGSGLGNCEKDLKKYCPGAEIAPGLAITGSHVGESLDSIRKWLESFKF